MWKNYSHQNILESARVEETKYNWFQASKIYETALDSASKQKEYCNAGEIAERIGFCFHRVAMQAETREEFTKRMKEVVRSYDMAYKLYEKLVNEQKTGRLLRCSAFKNYVSYWLTSDPAERRKLLDDCLELEQKSLEAFFDQGAWSEYIRTFNELAPVIWHRSFLEWDRNKLKKIIERGMGWAEKTIQMVSKEEDPHEMSGAFYAVAIIQLCDMFGYSFIADLEKREQHISKTIENYRKTITLADSVGDAYLVGLSHLWMGLYSGEEKNVTYIRKALTCGEETQDNYLRASALDFLAYFTYWSAFGEEDFYQFMKLAKKAMEFYDEAQRCFALINYPSPRWGVLGAPNGYCEHYFYLAAWETSVEKKLQLLEMSTDAGMDALKLAKASDIPLIISSTFHGLSKTLEARASLELDVKIRRNLLIQALEYRDSAMKIDEQLIPFDYWDRGVMHIYLADIMMKLGDLETAVEGKRKYLFEAVAKKEHALELLDEGRLFLEKIGRLDVFAGLAGHQDSYVVLLNRLYNLTNDPTHLVKAIEISHNVIESANKLNLVSRIAESYWKIAQAQDVLGDHVEAVTNFKLASQFYRKGVKKIPQLQDFYEDYARYMEAWEEIEKAKHHHKERRYEQARKHYETAANLHESTKSWRYLTSNYLAWARLEEAESLSRNDQFDDAKYNFQEAAHLFIDSKKAIEAKIEKMEDENEKKLVKTLVKAANIRHKYCIGRISLEEARIFDRQGDHFNSSLKFGIANSTFQEVNVALEKETERQEILPILDLSKAWQMMTKAEAEVSPELYLEASKLFEQAKEHTKDEKAKTLAIGHSIFCRALEAGTRFEKTRDSETYSTAKKHLIAAENYYIKAGFKQASEYARGTHRFLDAYIYLDKAETEFEPNKKSQYYQISAKLLQTAINSYSKAKHPEKINQVQRLLERVIEEQKLTTSLHEILHTPPITLSTESFVTPSQTYEKAIGLDRFENANIQGKISVSEYVTVGEEFEFQLDLFNVGKNKGLLVRIDDLIPKGFQLTVTPSKYTVENNSINIKGWSLQSLQIESIKLHFQPSKPGSYELCPQIIYVDETGKFKTCKPEPATITVQPKSTFEFKIKTAKSVFDFLLHSFIEDYMRRRISLEKSGWRTLMEAVKSAKVSKSSVYGTKKHRGRAITELERRGLIETRIFLGERGRGGRILKMRIAYDKETIKRYIDQQIMKIKEK